ncbi:hypothetical protein [Paraburkholderia unamae]|uniref:Uncharacterized protein n=1 Tax=Paraburkholderia unamae TaxID=219649 RepID=A0ACC6RQH0_9BURK
MVVQRLTIRASSGKLQVIPVWRCLAQSGATIVRWRMCVDRNAGIDLMTVDLIESDPLRMVEIATALGAAPLEMTVTAINLTVISNPAATLEAKSEGARKIADSLRPTRLLTLLSNTENPTAHIPRD